MRAAAASGKDSRKTRTSNRSTADATNKKAKKTYRRAPRDASMITLMSGNWLTGSMPIPAGGGTTVVAFP